MEASHRIAILLLTLFQEAVLRCLVPIPLVDLQRQYQQHKQEFDKAIAAVLERSSFILGEEVKRFEKSFAEFCETKYCIGLNSGSDALFLSLKALGVKPGDEVITTPYTYIATLFSIQRTGATIKLVDIDPGNYQIDPAQIRKAITTKTKAILPVHLYGHPADMQQIQEIADKHSLAVVEDACQSHGARAYGKRVGSTGTAGCFSFYPSKNLGAYGDGGAIVTNDAELCEQLQVMRNQGDLIKYVHTMEGFNSRLDAIQAAVLSAKLRHLEQWNRQRRKHAATYTELLQGVVECPTAESWAEHVYHLYIIRTKKQQQLIQHLQNKGIGTGVYYPKLCHLQDAFKPMHHLGYTTKEFPVGAQYTREVVALPMFAELTEEEIEQVAREVKSAVVV